MGLLQTSVIIIDQAWGLIGTTAWNDLTFLIKGRFYYGLNRDQVKDMDK